MKNKHRILLFLMIITVCLPLIGCRTATDAINAADNDPWLNDPNSGYSILNQNEKSAYLSIRDGIMDHNTVISIADCNIDTATLKKIWMAILKDNPIIFWCLDNSFTFEEPDHVLEVSPKYTFEPDEVDKILTHIEKIKNETLSLLPENGDDYDKVKFIHDLLINSITYDETAENGQNLYSALIEGRSVCTGYSKAFQYLLEEAGIYSTIVPGSDRDQNAHCWNMVKMDGDYYHIDVTYDDYEEDDDARVLYNYFGITTEERLKDCSIDETNNAYTDCTAVDDNYFVREGMILNYSDFFDFFDACVSGREKIIHCKIPNSNDLDRIIKDAPSHSPGLFKKLKYLRDDDHNVLTIIILY